MVANRCFAPSSKLCAFEQWLAEDVYFPEGKDIKLHHLYMAMDFLDRHMDDIEEELYWHIGDLLNQDVDLIFYDTTSVLRDRRRGSRKQEKRVQQGRQGRKPSDRCGHGGDPGWHSGENLGVPR